MGKVKHRKTKNPGTDLQEKGCSQWRVVSMQATSSFSDTRISIFQNISTSRPLHQSYSSKTMRFAAWTAKPATSPRHWRRSNFHLDPAPWNGAMANPSEKPFQWHNVCLRDAKEMDPVLRHVFSNMETHWEGMDPVVCRIWLLFWQIEVENNSIGFHPDSVSIHFSHVLSQKSGCLKSSCPSSPEWVQDQPPSRPPHPALPNLRIPILCKERSMDRYKWPLYVYHFIRD